MFTRMIKTLQTKMEGFSHRETNAYYRSIMNKAWEQVRSAPKEKLPADARRKLEWLVLDDGYETKLNEMGTGDLFFPGPRRLVVLRPPAPFVPSGRAPPEGAPGSISQSATGLVSSIETFSSALVGDVGALTTSITQVTNPPPVRTSSGSSGWTRRRRMRLCLRLRRMRLRLRRGRTMKKYSSRKLSAVIAVSLAVSGFLAFAVQQFLVRGRFLDVALNPVPYAAPQGWTPFVVVFAAGLHPAVLDSSPEPSPTRNSTNSSNRACTTTIKAKNSEPNGSTCGSKRTGHRC